MTLRERLERTLARFTCDEEPGIVAEYDVGTGRALGELFPTGEVWRGPSGVCWTLAEDMLAASRRGGASPWLHLLHAQVSAALVGPPREGARGWPHQWRAGCLAVLDVETCGLRSMPAFMVGMLIADARGLILSQALARDYAEEPALLEWTGRMLEEAGGVITFNGSSFDLPYLRDRRVYHRQPPWAEPPHLDMLHVARRVWGKGLPNCRLQTLEEHLTGRVRRDDIPGCDIPNVYHAYVQSGDARPIRTILRHNRLDLLTLAEIFAQAWHHLRHKDTE